MKAVSGSPCSSIRFHAQPGGRRRGAKQVLRRFTDSRCLKGLTRRTSSNAFCIADNPSCDEGEHRYFGRTRARSEDKVPECAHTRLAFNCDDICPPGPAGTLFFGRRFLKEIRTKNKTNQEEAKMGFGRGALLWLLGVPLPIILLLALFWHH